MHFYFTELLRRCWGDERREEKTINWMKMKRKDADLQTWEEKNNMNNRYRTTHARLLEGQGGRTTKHGRHWRWERSHFLFQRWHLYWLSDHWKKPCSSPPRTGHLHNDPVRSYPVWLRKTCPCCFPLDWGKGSCYLGPSGDSGPFRLSSLGTLQVVSCYGCFDRLSYLFSREDTSSCKIHCGKTQERGGGSNQVGERRTLAYFVQNRSLDYEIQNKNGEKERLDK